MSILEDPNGRISNALRLEVLQHHKETEAFNGECGAEVAQIIRDHAARGILQSSMTVRRIAEAHLKRARRIIDDAISRRRASLHSVPELATDAHWQNLLDQLEHTADAVCASIPEHVGRYVPGTPDHQRYATEAAKLKSHARRELEIMKGELALARDPQPRPVAQERPAAQPDARRVFVVHGRNLKARDAMFAFLRSIDLDPIEWDEAVSFTGEASPFTGQVLERVFLHARAVVVLFTGDDLARLGTRYQESHDPPHEIDLTPQARPNVLFEAGMAFGRCPERTILVSLGHSRPFSDIAGRNAIRITDDARDRQALIGRLRTAGCAVKTNHRTDWTTAGDFASAIQTADYENAERELDSIPMVAPPPPAGSSGAGEPEADDVAFFKTIRARLIESGANTWVPEMGSKEEQIAERMADRGWFARSPVGEYILRRYR